MGAAAVKEKTPLASTCLAIFARPSKLSGLARTTLPVCVNFGFVNMVVSKKRREVEPKSFEGFDALPKSSVEAGRDDAPPKSRPKRAAADQSGY